MNHLAIAGAIALAVTASGCATVQKFFPKSAAFVCANEPKAHAFYVKLVGPFRSPEQRAKEQRAFEAIMDACAKNAPPAVIEQAANAAIDARN